MFVDMLNRSIIYTCVKKQPTAGCETTYKTTARAADGSIQAKIQIIKGNLHPTQMTLHDSYKITLS
jgi:hypothetical protein